MCGRYSLKASAGELIDLFALAKDLSIFDGLGERSEFRPTNPVPIIRSHDGLRRLTFARWGLIPGWFKMKPDLKLPSMFNARGETVAEKPSFRASFKRKRCIIPATEFYEWREIAGAKNKEMNRVAIPSGQSMALAGLWDVWRNPEGQEIENTTIITCSPAEGSAMASLHDRMPVILQPEDWEVWLGLEQNPVLLQSLIKPVDEELVIEPVE